MTASERRCAPTEFEVRAKPDGSGGTRYVITGHAAVFNRLSQNLGGFVEEVDPAAFDRTLGDNPDTRALINHDPSLLLGRTRSGTLRLSKDSAGLPYEIDAPDTTYARDLIESLGREDITQSSFGFYLMRGGDEWTETPEGFPKRVLKALSIHNGDVSPVTYPAYEDTDSGLAGRAFASLAETRSLPLEAIRAAAEAGTLRDLIVGEPALDLDAIRSKAAARSRALDLLGASLRDLG